MPVSVTVTPGANPPGVTERATEDAEHVKTAELIGAAGAHANPVGHKPVPDVSLVEIAL